MEIGLRFMTTTGTAPYYSWPLVEDLSWEPQSVIIRVLDKPEERRIPTNKRKVLQICRVECCRCLLSANYYDALFVIFVIVIVLVLVLIM